MAEYVQVTIVVLRDLQD